MKLFLLATSRKSLSHVARVKRRKSEYIGETPTETGTIWYHAWLTKNVAVVVVVAAVDVNCFSALLSLLLLVVVVLLVVLLLRPSLPLLCAHEHMKTTCLQLRTGNQIAIDLFGRSSCNSALTASSKKKREVFDSKSDCCCKMLQHLSVGNSFLRSFAL